MHRAILLLTGLAIGSCLRVNFPEEQKCVGGDCMKLMDDIHWNPKDKRTSSLRSLPEVSNRLQSIYCEKSVQGQGPGSCKLSYLDQGDSKPTKPDSPTFYDIALKSGTDKVTMHHFDDLYQRYLGDMSSSEGSNFTFVEIGFSEGKSARAWDKWLPRADVHEFDANCDQEYNSHATAPDHLNLHALPEQEKKHRQLEYCKLHCGDGTNNAFIDESLAGVEAPFVVIDDGGHGPDEMKDSFKNWWPRVQPGGLFFMEDLECSYEQENGFVETYIKPIVQDLFDAPKKPPVYFQGIESVECMQAICVFRKKK